MTKRLQGTAFPLKTFAGFLFVGLLVVLAMWAIGRDSNQDLQTSALILTLIGVAWYSYETHVLRRAAQEQLGIARQTAQGAIAPLLAISFCKDGVVIVRNVGNGPALGVEWTAEHLTNPETRYRGPTIAVLTTGRGRAQQGWTSLPSAYGPPWVQAGTCHYELLFADLAGTRYRERLTMGVSHDGWRIESYGPIEGTVHREVPVDSPRRPTR